MSAVGVESILKAAKSSAGAGMALNAVLKMQALTYMPVAVLRRHGGMYYNCILELWQKDRRKVDELDPCFWRRVISKFFIMYPDQTTERAKRLHEILAMYPGSQMLIVGSCRQSRSFTARDMAKIGCSLSFKGDNVRMTFTRGFHGQPTAYLNHRALPFNTGARTADLKSYCLVQTGERVPVNTLIVTDVRDVVWHQENNWAFTLEFYRVVVAPLPPPRPQEEQWPDPSNFAAWYATLPDYRPTSSSSHEDEECMFETAALTGVCPFTGMEIQYPVISADCSNVSHQVDGMGLLLAYKQTRAFRYFRCPTCNKQYSIARIRRVVRDA